MTYYMLLLVYISPSKFLLNFTIEFCPNLYTNLSEHSVINRPASAVPDFGHLQFLYVYKYKICIRHFCSQCASVGRKRKLRRSSTLGFGPGHKKGMLPWCVSAYSPWGRHPSSGHISPHRVWQQGEKCASPRCKLDREERTYKVMKHFLVYILVQL